MTEVSARPATRAVAADTPRGVDRGEHGTGIRDATLAEFLALAVCLAVAVLTGLTRTGAGGVVLGLGVVAAAGVSVVNRPGRWSGPADRVSLVRAALIGGCATLTVLVVAGEQPARSWWLIGILVPALALDRVDGAVARFTGTSSAWGGRLDGELDAVLLMIISVAAVRSMGWWVLAIGLMRYVYWAAGLALPRLRDPLDFSQFRRVVAGLQGVSFAVALAPVTPLWLGHLAVGGALILLTVSFSSCVHILLFWHTGS